MVNRHNEIEEIDIECVNALKKYGRKHDKTLLTLTEAENVLRCVPGAYASPRTINPGICEYEGDTTLTVLRRVEELKRNKCGGIKVLVSEMEYLSADDRKKKESLDRYVLLLEPENKQ
jgi:hypothetical protein